jgi:hypothetical protein
MENRIEFKNLPRKVKKGLKRKLRQRLAVWSDREISIKSAYKPYNHKRREHEGYAISHYELN